MAAGIAEAMTSRDTSEELRKLADALQVIAERDAETEQRKARLAWHDLMVEEAAQGTAKAFKFIRGAAEEQRPMDIAGHVRTETASWQKVWKATEQPEEKHTSAIWGIVCRKLPRISPVFF